MFEGLVKALAVWRITSLLQRERGPYDVFGKLRDAVGVRYDEMTHPYGETEIARAFVCFWCLSFWVALAVCRGKVLQALAASAAAILLEETSHVRE